uniref:Uncharacterized protein n=1 Tax=Arundo donax TaxID=35708 RepID=A0A0A8ZH36_ARUDO
MVFCGSHTVLLVLG